MSVGVRACTSPLLRVAGFSQPDELADSRKALDRPEPAGDDDRMAPKHVATRPARALAWSRCVLGYLFWLSLSATEQPEGR
jgi:hypothetical protein